jgi:hypothetical protein
MTRTLLTAIFLTLFSQMVRATDAETFFKQYNDNGYIIAEMICGNPLIGEIVTVTNDGTLDIGGYITSSQRNGNTLQFYSTDSLMALFFDFKQKIFITIDHPTGKQTKQKCFEYVR